MADARLHYFGAGCDQIVLAAAISPRAFEVDTPHLDYRASKKRMKPIVTVIIDN
jgi:hypothetical protein